MKVKLLAALAVAMGLVSGAQAAAYTVGGTQSVLIEELTAAAPGQPVGTLIATPDPVTFAGSWTVDLSAPSAAGTIGFVPYQLALDLTPLFSMPGMEATLNVASRTLAIGSTAASYDAATRTLTVTGIQVAENQSSQCSDSGGVMLCQMLQPEDVYHGDLTMVFAPDLQSFNAVAHLYQRVIVGADSSDMRCTIEGAMNSCFNTTLTFSGVVEVPVPAAAWLFGSSLLGLAGLQRRKAV